MNNSNKLLSDLVSSRTYSKYIPHLERREIFEETINRVMTQHLEKFPKLSREITKAFSKVHDLQVLPSMRTLQFSGPAIEKNHARSYNCSYTSISYTRSFSEILFLLLSGTGVGFSVQSHHIKQLPKIRMPRDESRFLIPDTIEGWAQALETLIQAYFHGAVRPLFDYSLIRAKGSRLVTSGSKAPGSEALRLMLQEVESKLKLAVGRQLKSLEAHDIICLVSEAVLAGGVRRSALISFFDRDDKDLLTCKAGNWWEKYPYRARANNSAVLPRKEVTKEEFLHIFKMCEDSNAGEPGFFWTSDESLEMAGNPCMEISLNPQQMCNLSTINLTTVKDERDFLARVHSATLLGTLQAAYTDFHYLNDNWRKTTEKEALLGVSMTGIADVPGLLTPDLLRKGALLAKEINEKYAKKLGINPAARITSIKPEGTASCVLGSSSGVHARKSQYYIRRFQISKNDALYDYLLHKMPNLVEDYKMALNTAVVSIPQQSPVGSISENDETAVDLFKRVNMLNEHWIAPGHRAGANKHNVSCTLSIKPDEWSSVGEMAWKTKSLYTGISCLPFDGGTYQQAPFESISKETFESMSSMVPDLDLREVREVENNTSLIETQACAAGACEIKTI